MTKNMPQMARDGKNGFGEKRPYATCEGCKQSLPQNLFSYVKKDDPSQGIRKKCKTCSATHAQKAREQRKLDWKHKPRQHMLMNSKQRAKASGIEHTLVLEDIIIPDVCPVLGIKLVLGSRREHGNAPSIDRIDNTKGYTKDNIMIISCRANLLKRDATLEELTKIGEFYHKYLHVGY